MAARPLLERLTALPKIELKDSLLLHQALFSAYEANWGLATASLAEALELIKDGFSSENRRRLDASGRGVTAFGLWRGTAGLFGSNEATMCGSVRGMRRSKLCIWVIASTCKTSRRKFA